MLYVETLYRRSASRGAQSARCIHSTQSVERADSLSDSDPLHRTMNTVHIEKISESIRSPNQKGALPMSVKHLY